MENSVKVDRHENDGDAELQVFELASVLSRAEALDDWKNRDRSAFTLSRFAGLHVTLIAMHAGTVKPWHRVGCPISLQVLQGKLDFITPSATAQLKSGDLIVLQAGIRHHMKVHEDSVVLLSLGAAAR